MQKRKKFTKEFKLEALRLMKESGKPAADVATPLKTRAKAKGASPGSSPAVQVPQGPKVPEHQSTMVPGSRELIPKCAIRNAKPFSSPARQKNRVRVSISPQAGSPVNENGLHQEFSFDSQSLILDQMLDAIDRITGKTPRINGYGSARIPSGNYYYERAIDFAKEMTEVFFISIISGGGPGIMEALNRGAQITESWAESIGLNIKLPEEQNENPYQTISIVLKHFFTRLMLFLYYGYGSIAFPGGFGTEQEKFETWEFNEWIPGLAHPVVLFDNKFNKEFITWMHGDYNANILRLPPDKLFTVFDCPKKAAAHLAERLDARQEREFAPSIIAKLMNDLSRAAHYLRRNSFFPGVAISGGDQIAEDSPLFKEIYNVTLALQQLEGIQIYTRGDKGCAKAVAAAYGQYTRDHQNHNKGLVNFRVLGRGSVLPQADIEYKFEHYVAMNVLYQDYGGQADIITPGSVKTLSHLFRTLCLMQTKKIPRHPLFLYPGEYWEPRLVPVVENHLRHGLIDEKDVHLFQLVSNADEIVQGIDDFQRTARVEKDSEVKPVERRPKTALVSKPRKSRPVKVQKRSLEKNKQNILEQVPVVSRKAVERALKRKHLSRRELKRVEENIVLQIERLVAEQLKGGAQVNYHIQGVSRTARELAAYYGLSQTKVLLFEVAGLVHDVGKLYSKEILETLVTGAMPKEEFSQRQKMFYTAHEELSLLMLEEKSWIDIPLVLHIVILGTERFKVLEPEIKRYCPYTWKELEQMAALFRLTDSFVALTEKGRRYSHPVLTKNNVGEWLNKKKQRGPWAKGLKRKKILEFFKSAADPSAKGNTPGSSPVVPENQTKGKT